MYYYKRLAYHRALKIGLSVKYCKLPHKVLGRVLGARETWRSGLVHTSPLCLPGNPQPLPSPDHTTFFRKETSPSSMSFHNCVFMSTHFDTIYLHLDATLPDFYSWSQCQIICNRSAQGDAFRRFAAALESMLEEAQERTISRRKHDLCDKISSLSLN